MDGEGTDRFLTWFQTRGGSYDANSMGITVFPPAEGGRGAIALKDIPEGHLLFSIPRSLSLSTRTSTLPKVFGLAEWKQLELHKGWAGLILCMMWEAARGKESNWAEYLDTLPTAFDTPMFWTQSELEELAGTSIVGKLGKEDAERDYEGKVRPALKRRPDIFGQNDKFYSLEMYHTMGSRILSRSFNVEKWEGDDEDGEGTSELLTVGQPTDDAMDIDDANPEGTHTVEAETEEEDREEEDDEEEDSSDVAMVPMADMLNARFGTENAKLFYEKNDLMMISTKPIKIGEQIWNTYGDLPNAELLRRYGHVDLLPLPDGTTGNPSDLVELSAEIIVGMVKELHSQSSEGFVERIDWWLEEGGDDVFEFDCELDLPPAALSLIRLLLLTDGEWNKVREKGKPPKPKADSDVLLVLEKALNKRCKEYSSSIEDDESRLQGELTLNVRHAIVVRLSEKRILQNTLNKIATLLHNRKPQDNKRKAEAQSDSGTKKSKRK
ncbi:SET domain-containing protein [Coprinopsis marcescibilis]|uniref:Ribosomal lysine N-methyltransferase 4 n=1 Tax=Coprinopsis marcescibilis TaxID=230819 RepID=A0A5C3KY02_COPMA|nr:SET domain-containing protein [Coprinopsis marcescibilis]